MDDAKKFLHDRVILGLTTLMSILVVLGVSLVFLRFDAAKNPTTIVAYRQNISGTSYVTGKPLDIYSLAIFMVLISAGALVLSLRLYKIYRHVAIFVLATTIFLLVLTAFVANSLINLQ